MAISRSLSSFELKSPDALSALDALEPTSRLERAELHKMILGLLAIIRDPAARYKDKRKQTPANAVRKLRAWAKSAERMSDSLASQAWPGDPPIVFVSWSDPPVEELREYAQHLKEQAEALAKQVHKTQNRHHVHQQTPDILGLVLLVRETTGRPHWKEIATLIREATQDQGWNEDRLRKMSKYHLVKNPASSKDMNQPDTA